MKRMVNLLLFTSFLNAAYAQNLPVAPSQAVENPQPAAQAATQPPPPPPALPTTPRSIIESTFGAGFGSEQLIDLDLRTRPIFRHDTYIPPKEFRDNDPEGPNGHLPKVMTENDMHNVLLDAIIREDMQVLKRLRVERDIDLNVLDDSDNTLLDYAILNKKYQSVKFLVYNEAFSNHDLTDYLGMAIDKKDPSILQIIEFFNLYEKFNERHFIHAFAWNAVPEILFILYDALDPTEKYKLFNYYAERYFIPGLRYMAEHNYDINNKLYAGEKLLDYAIGDGDFKGVNALFELEPFLSHEHIYSAYLNLMQYPDDFIRMMPKLATYGLKYELHNDIRTREYMIASKKMANPVYTENMTSEDVEWLDVSVNDVINRDEIEIHDEPISSRSHPHKLKNRYDSNPAPQYYHNTIEKESKATNQKPSKYEDFWQSAAVVDDKPIINKVAAEPVFEVKSFQEAITPVSKPVVQPKEYSNFWDADEVVVESVKFVEPTSKPVAEVKEVKDVKDVKEVSKPVVQPKEYSNFWDAEDSFVEVKEMKINLSKAEQDEMLKPASKPKVMDAVKSDNYQDFWND